jgi:hypothetical protein
LGRAAQPSAFRGELCFGPNQGQNVTFARPDRWLPPEARGAGPLDPPEALKEMARRYLDAFGPANPEDFARWWGTQPAPAKKVFKSLGGELAPVSVEGWSAWALAARLPEIQSQPPALPVRLLPLFDAYTVGVSRADEYLLAEADRARVYRPQGWISAVVLVEGRIRGAWESRRQGDRTVVQVEMFQPPDGKVAAAIEAEAKQLGEFLGSEIELAYA